ncbi:hypothetical protein LTR37_019408 [Vermiconidia calcicola]|uniref:Uncharacterized protein n=1 Tax=Vermiconidia calcicola TaxID=1690605 RepID=A0ACC3MFE4_9PEZI|nr:hypothetical protein LTR37_019408 [Vermiconidia calcicola]
MPGFSAIFMTRALRAYREEAHELPYDEYLALLPSNHMGRYTYEAFPDLEENGFILAHNTGITSNGTAPIRNAANARLIATNVCFMVLAHLLLLTTLASVVLLLIYLSDHAVTLRFFLDMFGLSSTIISVFFYVLVLIFWRIEEVSFRRAVSNAFLLFTAGCIGAALVVVFGNLVKWIFAGIDGKHVYWAS